MEVLNGTTTLRNSLAVCFFNFYFIIYLFIILLYNIVLVLPYINMNPPRVYLCSQSWTPLPPPSSEGLAVSYTVKHMSSVIQHEVHNTFIQEYM